MITENNNSVEKLKIDFDWQPIFKLNPDFTIGRVVKTEMLARFYLGDRRLNTQKVIDRIGHIGFEQMLKFDEVAFKFACSNLCNHPDLDFSIVVNLSPLSLKHAFRNGEEPDFIASKYCEWVRHFKEQHNCHLDCERFGVELLETSIHPQGMSGSMQEEFDEWLIDALSAFRERGFYVYIDDYGAIESNAFRATLPSDGVKIDGGIVKGLLDKKRKNGAKVLLDTLKGIMDGRLMDEGENRFDIVFEHIETKKELDAIIKYLKMRNMGNLMKEGFGIHLQGYYLSEPMGNIPTNTKSCA